MIIDAALRCFGRSGVAQVNMEDIASEAGISRKTIYRHFEDRQALIQKILLSLFADALNQVKITIPRFDNFATALVEGTGLAMKILSANFVLVDLINNEATHGVRLMLMRNDLIRQMMENTWLVAFDEARRAGTIRSPLSDEELIDGLRSLGAMLMLRTDLNLDEKKAFLRQYFVPAILKEGEAG